MTCDTNIILIKDGAIKISPTGPTNTNAITKRVNEVIKRTRLSARNKYHSRVYLLKVFIGLITSIVIKIWGS